MIAGDYGDVIRVQTGIDLTPYAGNLTIEFRHRERDRGRREWSTNTGVSIGVASLQGGGISYLPNQYMIYTFSEGDILDSEPGEWQARGVIFATTPALRRSGPWQSFTLED